MINPFRIFILFSIATFAIGIPCIAKNHLAFADENEPQDNEAPEDTTAPVSPAYVDPYSEILQDLDRQILEKEGIEATRESIENYLTNKREVATRAAALIAQWGDTDYRVRVEAFSEILTMPDVPRSLLEDVHLNHPDAEVRWRAGDVLLQKKPTDVLGLVADRKISRALIRTIKLNALSDCGEILHQIASDHLMFEIHYLASDALLSIANENQDLVEAWLTDEEYWVRAFALKAGYALNLIDADYNLDAFTTWERPASVRLLTALSMIDNGDRRGVEVLIALLDDNIPSHERMYAMQALQAICDIPEPFEDVYQGEQWFAAEGQSIHLQIPYELKFNSFNLFLSRVQVFSSGFARGNSCGIFYGGATIVGREGLVEDFRGISIFAIHNEEILLAGSYDIYALNQECGAFVDDIESLPEGTFVAVAISDAIGSKWNNETQRALESIGAETNLKNMQRAAYYCIGYKGMASGKGIELLDLNEGPIFYPESLPDEVELWSNVNHESRQGRRTRLYRGIYSEIDSSRF